MPVVTLFSKPRCRACDQARYYLYQLLAAQPEKATWTLEEINILYDPRLFAMYSHTIPVVVVDGGPPLQTPYSLDVAYLRQILHIEKGRDSDGSQGTSHLERS
ncbi:MAG: glutaredoxin family protein [Chloroflexia bacterium]